MEHGKCRLCLTDGLLCDSHILPRFWYDPIRDDRGKLFTVESTMKVRRLVKSRSQGGIKEPLLCEQCEGRFNKYETYMTNEFPEPIGTPTQDSYQGIDYKRFRLYQLSILWRMSQSASPIFREVTKIPEEIKEDLRIRLLNEEPGEEYEYPCLWGKVIYHGRSGTAMFLQPMYLELNSDDSIFMVHDNLIWIFVLTKYRRRVLDGGVKKDGSLLVKIDPHFERSTIYKNILRRMQRAGLFDHKAQSN